jgi:fermentation-respiration switch protein FrsA (DUF1100 family)
MGGSEGAMMVYMSASELPDVTAAIAMNGGGQFFLDTLLHNIKMQVSEKDYPEVESMMLAWYGAWQHGQYPKENFESDHGLLWWQEMLNNDQLAMLKKIHVPLLILQAEQDESVPADDTQKMINAVSDQKNITYISYPGLNHAFRDAEGMRKESKVIADIRQWLQRVLKK